MASSNARDLSGPHPSPRPGGPVPQVPTRTELLPLARLLEQAAPFDGRHDLPFPGVHVVRASRPNTDLVHGMFRPSVCIVAQGAKRVFLGPEVYEYDTSRMLLCSVELPMAGEVVRARYDEPYLGLILDLDPPRVAELAFKVFPDGLPPVREHGGVYLGEATAEIVNAAVRLLASMTDPRQMALLAPMAVDEIVIRLLCSPVGGRVAQLGQTESHVQRVARAVNWVREHFDQPMNVELLAELVHLSPSAFHRQFRAVTNVSPLQFQKNLRLREARRLMLVGGLDVTTASRQVGYVSSSQFIREYGRLFGNAPARDIALLREQGQAPAALN
ncbi:AraC family transcriptional regulator [Deinococcus aestuarii]|uniref:AraC family transcriptional regulator n=1 Tax=Deinococcus aestuarii TaxID=2774531 RepID=UPI001C0DB2AB|nr:AraC family transcriptional regulator [Deinococcus aestuarii]